MAISVYEKLGQKIPPKSTCSKSSNLNSCLMKVEYEASGSSVSIKNDSTNRMSPYLSGDKVHLHSRVTERKLIRKKTDFVSSYPLAVNIYKANSDEFKFKRSNKKVKKSVLTLPNEPTPVPQLCTVSDMTESEYFNENKDERKPKTRKKRAVQNNRKLSKTKNFDIYDRDARYCSQLNVDLDSSSTDFINRFPGDGKKKSRRKPKKTDVKAHDVWAMLRNMNQFQFVPSAPMSQDSVVSVKRSNLKSKRNNCRDARLIETCRTEEFAYISNFVDNSHSQSSLDRVTVIDKQEDYQKICKEIEKSVESCKTKFSRANQKKNKPKVTRRINLKSITNNVNNIENNKRQVNEAPSNDICTLVNEQKNETSGAKTYSIDNENNDQFYDYNDSNQTNSPQTVDLGKQEQQGKKEDYKQRKKTKQQITGITKVVVSKGNHVSQELDYDEGKNSDITSTVAAPIAKPPEQENPAPLLIESCPTRTRRGKLASGGKVKAVSNGDTKINKAKGNTNTISHKLKTKDDTSELERNAIDTLDPDTKQKRQLKDKMMHLLYKKHQDVIDEGNGDSTILENAVVEVGTNTQIECDNLENTNSTKDMTELRKKSSSKRYWGKGKWASDFIDSVIRKIRSGVYYSHEDKPPVKYKFGKREDSSQTDINHRNTPKPQFLITSKDIDFNPPKYNFKTFNRTKTEERLPLNDEIHNNKPNLAVREDNKKINFEDFDNTHQINFQKNLTQRETVKSLTPVKHSWVEGKWASDFIDNIFKKIKNGVYYTHEEHCQCKNQNVTTDDSSQTDGQNLNSLFNPITDVDIIEKSKIQNTNNCDSLTPLPGFDAAPNDLEIETYNQKQIVVKNCVTNIVVKFDVQLPVDTCQSLQVKQSLSCIPVAVTDDQTKIFKSKTTIINAFLPAELCSILPMIMNKIITSHAKFALPKLKVGKVESNLSTITELTRSDSLEFPKEISHILSEPRTDLLFNMKSMEILNFKTEPSALIELKHDDIPEAVLQSNSIIPQRVICMALQIYNPHNQVVPAYERFNIKSYIESLIYTKTLTMVKNTLLIINSFKVLCLNKNIAISIEFENCRTPVNILISNIPNYSKNTSFEKSIKFNEENCDCNSQTNTIPKVLDIYTNKSRTNLYQKKNKSSEIRPYNKSKKKGFVRLYKKCKSMSNLSNYKQSISIDKITNCEEFLQTLGLSKVFTSVVDGNMEQKIMSSLKEMRSWKTDITPRQAFLVLLLANKKDTSSVLRYRPVILQGIAVSRITKSSELDMEIEVIEGEKLNRLSQQFEGISYVPASVENQDALLEELYWIAKTTASDYQRPFDESSERLLKSLLEKRKKLNPSYLRVMARYVGLGLLKSSK
ncbi:hypothetical protein KGM_208033 [Danaus plexippus plexippus]|uniref:Uncharacterized protein n=1 Tax=Danaus plexippus plexippus TaxID=278856 RepID=A0A212F881_DANPL|nr:hypothetical protein KGM_208033 [Danaus plexippus plexippus]